VPNLVIKAKCSPYLERGKPAAQRALQNLGDHDIVAATGPVPGIVQYYLLAGDIHRMDACGGSWRPRCLKTLAAKHDSTVTKMAAATRPPSRPARAAHLLRGCPHPRGQPDPWSHGSAAFPSNGRNRGHHRPRSRPGPLPPQEIITRLLRNRCELCQHSGQVQVHHVARLADLAYPGHGQPAWARLMAKRRRKSSWSARPVTTRSMPNGHQPQPRRRSLESRMPGNLAVRFGGGPYGKGPANCGHLAVRPTQLRVGVPGNLKALDASHPRCRTAARAAYPAACPGSNGRAPACSRLTRFYGVCGGRAVLRGL